MDIRPEDREMWFARLNPLLEHQMANFGSGNGNANLKMTAKLIAVSNPVWNTATMGQLCSQLDSSFLGRLLIWYQDKEHVDLVQGTRDELIKKRKLTLPLDIHIGIIDYMGSFKAEWDDDRIEEIYQNGLSRLTTDSQNKIKVRDVYKSRYNHHLKCLIDGIVKIRCLCEQDISFKAIEEDYSKLANLWDRMITNWGYEPKIEVSKI